MATTNALQSAFCI